MSAQQISGEPLADDEARREEEPSKDAMTSKLSQELNNWRRKRSNGRAPRRTENRDLNNFSSEPARTIKVRGHETLVIRKGKLSAKPRINPLDSIKE